MTLKPTWTPERIQQLVKLYNENYSGSAIAQELGLTRGAVLGKLGRMGLRLKRTPEKQSRAKAKPKARKPPGDGFRATQRASLMSTDFNEKEQVSYGKPRNFHQLREGHCRWPLWQGVPPMSEKFYCGAKAVKGFVYCDKHAAEAYRNWVPREPLQADNTPEKSAKSMAL